MFLLSRKKLLLILAVVIGTKFIFAQTASTFITASDYCAFLNNTAKADASFLYDQATGTAPDAACIARLGAPGNYFYQVIAGRETFPAPYLNEFAAALYNKINATGNDPTANLKSNRIYFFVIDAASSPKTLMFRLPIATPIAEDTTLELEGFFVNAVVILSGVTSEQTVRLPHAMSEVDANLEKIDVSGRPPTRRENIFQLIDQNEQPTQPPKGFFSSDTRRRSISTADISSHKEDEVRPFESTETISSNAIAELMPSIIARAKAESDKRLITLDTLDYYGNIKKSYLDDVEEEYQILQAKAKKLKKQLENVVSSMEFNRWQKRDAFLEKKKKAYKKENSLLYSCLPSLNQVHLTDEYTITPQEHELQLGYENLAETKRKYKEELITVQKELSKNVAVTEAVWKELSKIHLKIEEALQTKDAMLIKMATTEIELDLNHLQEEFLRRYEEEYSKLREELEVSGILYFRFL